MQTPILLFVCTGNTCRSPMAAALASSIYKDRGIDITILSAGVAAGDGFSASKNAVLAMQDEGLNLSTHVSTQVTQALLERATLVLTMTEAHCEAVKHILPTANAYTLCEYCDEDKPFVNISDPYGGNLEVYKNCAKQIKTLLHALVDIKNFGRTYE